jgi:Fic family protein
MTMETLEQLTGKLQSLTQGMIDYDKYNQYAISHHSTVIEGNTLTEIETQVFLDEGLTAKGKPLTHHLMVKDHLAALQFVVKKALEKSILSIPLIQEIGSQVMNNTGTVYNTALGSFDSSKGDFRLLNVSAGIRGKSYMNYSKVFTAITELCQDVNKKLITKLQTTEQINDLAFLLHYQFVTIHPFADGNGRTARLLMHYIQAYHNRPLTVIPSQNKTEYINALVATREKEDINISLDFMRKQHIDYLLSEIERLHPSANNRKNIGGIGLFF